MGKFKEIQSANRKITKGYDEGIYSYVRYSEKEKLIIVTNFSWITESNFFLRIPKDVIKEMNIADGSYIIKDQLYSKNEATLNVNGGEGNIEIKIKPSESFIFKL